MSILTMSRTPKIWIKREELPQLATGVYHLGRRSLVDDALPLARPVPIFCTSELPFPHSEESRTPFEVGSWVCFGFVIDWLDLKLSSSTFWEFPTVCMFCGDLPPANRD